MVITRPRRTGFAVAAARAIFPDLVEHLAEIPAHRIDVQSLDLHPISQKVPTSSDVARFPIKRQSPIFISLPLFWSDGIPKTAPVH
jgi:hypothetical protein